MLTSIQNSFSSGELSPSVFGRTDLQKYNSGASTYRNFFCNYRGGAASRAGTAYVGLCKQGAPNSGGTSTNNPPRDIRFQFNINQGYALEFGDLYMRIKSNGAYVVEANTTISAITTANPAVITDTAHGYSNGDWIFIKGIVGSTFLNGLTWIVTNKTTNTYQLTDLFGNAVSTIGHAYVSGGVAERIYTVVSPYAAIDLKYLKFTQSADTMSLTCVNQATFTEYPPYDLQRNGATNWSFTQTTFSSSINAPTGVAVTAQSSTTPSTYYSYVVTAVSGDGEESIASSPAQVENNNISIYAGSNTVTWSPITGATSYNVYAATPSYGVAVPIGVLYGFVGTSLATTFVDANITADFTTVPPQHKNPFSRGEIAGVTPVTGGSGYTQAGVTYSITTSTGSGAVIEPVVTGGAVVAYIVIQAGSGYALTDTITITADGTAATATLIIGAETGTYPSAVAYYQQRRAYANTLNNPDTYYMSQPGAFLNMDSSIPTTDADAIIGAPWAQQINGIQFLVPMPGGLVILSGTGAWQLNGGNSAALTPATQDANPQAYNGCSQIVPPIVVNYDILYVQAKGSIVRDLSYNFFVNIYTGTDTTILSNHLFSGHQILQWAYAEEPYKLIWCIREDGIMLSFTYLKEQDVYSWARHDTNGLFVSVASVTEPPVDAIYVIVQRYINSQWVYYSERMDNRLWSNVEQCWCVDAGLSLGLTYPNATLSPVSYAGSSNISGVNLIFGGSGYTAPVVNAIDSSGAGNGATFSVTVSVGVITAITPIAQGTKYTPGATELIITDATGSGAVASPLITNNVVFNASASVFSVGNVGQVIRSGGGQATIVTYTSGTQVVANVTAPITAVVPNDPNNLPIPQISGNWSLGIPVTSISGLNHLNGLTVSILADGSVVTPQTVVNNSITLPIAASNVVIGLPFTAQLQTMFLNVPEQGGGTTQGKRKNLFGATIRLEASRGMSVGSNQPDASTQPNGANVLWQGLYPVSERNSLTGAGNPIQLITADEYLPIGAEWSERGQVAIQTQNPLPVNVNSVISWYEMGDSSG